MGWLGLFFGASVIYFVLKIIIEVFVRPAKGDLFTNALFNAGPRGFFGNAAAWGLLRWWIIFVVVIVGGFVAFTEIARYLDPIK